MEAQTLDCSFSTGGEATLAEAIELYGEPLLRYCHHVLCDYHEAQDAVQITFIKAYDHRQRFQNGTSLRAWLYRLAYHTCIDLVRKRKWAFLEPPQEYADPNYLGEDLRRALDALSPQARGLVFGRVIEERSYDELAQIYQISATTLRKRYERARGRLARLLTEPHKMPKEEN